MGLLGPRNLGHKFFTWEKKLEFEPTATDRNKIRKANVFCIPA
jgi:hypothetical protein